MVPYSSWPEFFVARQLRGDESYVNIPIHKHWIGQSGLAILFFLFYSSDCYRHEHFPNESDPLSTRCFMCFPY